MSVEIVTLSPAIVASVESAWTDKASVIKSRGIATAEAVEAAGSVKSMIDALKAAGARHIKSAPVYGVVLGAAAMVTLAGYPLRASQVKADDWAILAAHVERAGKGPVLEAARAAVSPLLDDVTPAERLALILTAIDGVEDRKARTARGAGKSAAEKSDDDAAADGEGPTESGAYTPQDAGTVEASDAVYRHIRAALDLIETGAPVPDKARAALIKLASAMAVTAAALELELA